MRRAAVAIVALLVLAGCATAEPEPESEPAEKQKSEKTTEAEPAEPTANCIDLDKAALKSLRDGQKKGKVTEGAAVKLSKSAGYGVDYIGALKFGSGDVGLLAMGKPESGGSPWVVADDVAREYLNWGDMATKDSPMGQAAAAAAASPEADAARDCLG
jgi:hypothetical protein